jgi:hypothetical protein
VGAGPGRVRWFLDISDFVAALAGVGHGGLHRQFSWFCMARWLDHPNVHFHYLRSGIGKVKVKMH